MEDFCLSIFFFSGVILGLFDLRFFSGVCDSPKNKFYFD
jgi:hypothetical protein